MAVVSRYEFHNRECNGGGSHQGICSCDSEKRGRTRGGNSHNAEGGVQVAVEGEELR